MSNRTKLIAGVLALIVLLGAGYLLFFSSANNITSALSDTGAPASAAEVQFLNLSSQIGPISFDTSVFSDPRFMALTDIHTAILPESVGRNDPFASISGVSTGNTASTTGKP